MFFIFGMLYGSIVATLITYGLFSILYGQPKTKDILAVQKCLQENIIDE